MKNMTILTGLKYKVEHAAFELIIWGLEGKISFAANGIVKISGQISLKLVGLVEEDLPKFV